MEGVDLLRVVLSTPNAASLCIVFVFGTLFGSFINVCIARMPMGKSIVWPGSSCATCGVPVRPLDNIPVLSYLALGGRCHWCKARFSARYLAIEALVGAMAALLYWRFDGPGVTFFYGAVFSGLLVIVFFVDLDAWIILDEITWSGIAVGVLGAALLPPQGGALQELGLDLSAHPRLANVLWALLGAASGYLLFAAIAFVGTALVRQEAMGRGDVKFAALIGAFLGPSLGTVALLLSFPLGALVAIPLILLRRKSGKTPVPFGTFMAVAAFTSLVWGDRILLVLAGLMNPLGLPLD